MTYFETFNRDIDLGKFTAPEMDQLLDELYIHYNADSDSRDVESAAHDIRTVHRSIGEIATGVYEA